VCVCSVSCPACEAHAPRFIAVYVQLAKRMRRVLLPCMTSVAVSYFSTLSNRPHATVENKMCFGFLDNFFSEIFLILRRIQRDTVINTYRSKCRLERGVFYYLGLFWQSTFDWSSCHLYYCYYFYIKSVSEMSLPC